MLSYKSVSDGTGNDNERMAEVVMLLKDHIDALTSPGNHAQLWSKLKSGVRDDKFIREVDTAVLTIWVYDIIYTF